MVSFGIILFIIFILRIIIVNFKPLSMHELHKRTQLFSLTDLYLLEGYICVCVSVSECDRKYLTTNVTVCAGSILHLQIFNYTKKRSYQLSLYGRMGRIIFKNLTEKSRIFMLYSINSLVINVFWKDHTVVTRTDYKIWKEKA